MKIAVVIPAHNAARTVAEAVRSAQAQDLEPVSIVVVADACSDATAAIARECGAETIAIDQHSVAKARNTGIRATTEDWIALLDADDTWASTWLAAVAQRARSAVDAAVLYGEPQELDVDGRSLPPDSMRRPEGDVFEDLLSCNFVTTSAVVARRSALLACRGFDENFGGAGVEDYDLWLRLASQFAFASVPGRHVYYRRQPASAMRSPGRFDVLREQGLDIIRRASELRPISESTKRRSAAYIYRTSAERLLHHGFVPQARRDLRAALQRSPLDPRLWGLSLLSALRPAERVRLLKLRRRFLAWRASTLEFVRTVQAPEG